MKLLLCHPGASFSVADVYSGMSAALKRRGHDVQEYRLDWRIEEAHEFLNWRERRKKQQARRVGYPYVSPERGLMPDIIRQASMTLLEATLTVNPHCLIVFSAINLHPEAAILLRRMGVPIVLILTESPYDDGKQADLAPFAHMVYTNERASVRLMQRWWEQTGGKRGARNIEYLPHAYDPEKHTPIYHAPERGGGVRIEDVQAPRHDVVFVGSGFYERQEILQAVDWEGLGVDFGLYGIWPYIGSRNHLRKYLRAGTVPNERTVALYRQAKIGLNLYRQSVGTSRNATRIKDAESLNPRALELAATGTFHVSDNRPEVEEVFDGLVPTFKTAQQLEHLIGDWASDARATDRTGISRLLPKAVEGWTFDDRMDQLERGIAVARSGQS